MFKHLLYPNKISRYRAFTYHLLISTFILVTFLIIMFTLWYPGDLFYVDAGPDVLKILVGVDVILGPLLTLIVFKQGKKGLKFDLCVIATFQLSALMYGAYIIYTERPVFLVFTDDRYHLVSSDEVDPSKSKYDQFKKLSQTGPVTVMAKTIGFAEQVDSTMEQLNGGRAYEHKTENYLPYKPGDNVTLSSKRWPLEKYLIEEKHQRKFQKMKEKFARKELVLYPIYGRNSRMMLVVDRNKGDYVGTINIDHRVADAKFAARKAAEGKKTASPDSHKQKQPTS